MRVNIPLYDSEINFLERAGLSRLARLATQETIFPVGTTIYPNFKGPDGKRWWYEIAKVDVVDLSAITEEVALSLGYPGKGEGYPKELSSLEKFTSWWGASYPYSDGRAVAIYDLKRTK